MKKSQLDHLLRAAKEITGEGKFIIVGSQSLHGKGIDVDELLVSIEADLCIPGDRRKTEVLNSIGEASLFHETHGYYADPVDDRAALLPKGWRHRLVNLPPGDTNGAKGLCLDPHDMAVSKYIAGRDKDLELLRSLVRLGWLDEPVLLARLEDTAVDEKRRILAKNRISRHFAETPPPGRQRR